MQFITIQIYLNYKFILSLLQIKVLKNLLFFILSNLIKKYNTFFKKTIFFNIFL